MLRTEFEPRTSPPPRTTRHSATRRVFMQDNLKKKYGITDEELKSAVDQIPFGKIACDGIVLVALVDLISNGDIAPTEE